MTAIPAVPSVGPHGAGKVRSLRERRLSGPVSHHDICDGCAQGHDGMNYILASREAICDMIEVHGSVYPWDGIILSASCDKSIPAQLKAAARLDMPTIFIPGGSMRPGPDMTTSLVAGDISLRQKREGAVTEQEIRDYKLTGCPSCGACTFLGTASTMQCMAEAWACHFRELLLCRPPCGIFLLIPEKRAV